MVMNKRNTLTMLSLALVVAALSYTTLSPLATAFKQDMIVKGADATSGQPGNNVNKERGNYETGGNGVQNGEAADNQGNDQTQTGNGADNQGNDQTQTGNSNNNGNTN